MKTRNTPTLNRRDGGGVQIVLFSEVIPFEDNVSTILSSIVNCKVGVFCTANDDTINDLLPPGTLLLRWQPPSMYLFVKKI